MTRRQSSVRDWLVYIVISLLTVVAIVCYAEYSPANTEFPVGAVWLVLLTAIIFGYVAKAMRYLWNDWRFWALYFALISAHVIGFRLILIGMENHFLLLTSLAAGPEVLVICTIIELMLDGHDRQA